MNGLKMSDQMIDFAEKNTHDQKKQLTILGVIVILIAGILIRFIRLSAQPLTSLEARLAWQAFQVMQGQPAESLDVVAPVSFAAFTFWLTQANAFTARFWSVLLGCGLILLPWFWRKELGEKACMIISLGLAIDPLISASTRVLGSPMFSMATLLLALGFVKQRKFVLGGIGLALAFLGGSSFWLGIVSLSLAWAARQFGEKSAFNTDKSEPSPIRKGVFVKPNLWRLLAGFLASLGIIGSFFFIYPAGLGASSAGLLGFLQLFSNPSGVAPWQILLALLVYSIIPLVLSGIASFRGIAKRDLTTIFLASWALSALILILVMPGRQVFDLIWVILPVYVLSGRLLSEVLNLLSSGIWIRGAVTVFSLVIFTFLTLSIRSFALNILYTDQLLNFIISLLAGVILLILGFLLISIGWGLEHAWKGFLYAILILAVILSTSTSLSWVSRRSGKRAELWQTSATLDPVHNLENIIAEQSEYAYGKPFTASILVIANDDPTTRWALRKFEDVEFQSTYTGVVQADVILTDQTLNASINSDYRGTNTTLLNHLHWMPLSPKEIFQWTQSRKINQMPDQYYLWVKTDIMPFFGQKYKY